MSSFYVLHKYTFNDRIPKRLVNVLKRLQQILVEKKFTI